MTGAVVESIQIGAVTVHPIVDEDDQEWSAEVMLPQSSPEALRAAGPFAPPESYNAGTNALRFRFGGFFFEAGGRSVLVDAGLGVAKSRPEQAWNMRTGRTFLDELAACGASAQDVDVVVTTHAHADHVGWLTVRDGDRWVPTFPRAEYVFVAAELEHWVAQARRDASVNSGATADSVLPLLDAATVVTVGAGETIADGVTIGVYPGHTPGNAVVWLESQGAAAAFCGDTLHHPIQLRHPAWSCRFCWDAERSAQARRRLLEEVVDRAAVLLPSHFRTAASRIAREGDYYVPVDGSPAAAALPS